MTQQRIDAYPPLVEPQAVVELTTDDMLAARLRSDYELLQGGATYERGRLDLTREQIAQIALDATSEDPQSMSTAIDEANQLPTEDALVKSLDHNVELLSDSLREMAALYNASSFQALIPPASSNERNLLGKLKRAGKETKQTLYNTMQNERGSMAYATRVSYILGEKENLLTKLEIVHGKSAICLAFGNEGNLKAIKVEDTHMLERDIMHARYIMGEESVGEKELYQVLEAARPFTNWDEDRVGFEVVFNDPPELYVFRHGNVSKSDGHYLKYSRAQLSYNPHSKNFETFVLGIAPIAADTLQQAVGALLTAIPVPEMR